MSSPVIRGKSAAEATPFEIDDPPLVILRKCGGYYECPKDDSGTRLGPLVGYAGKYDGVHQFVGDVFYNFARIERCPRALDTVSAMLASKLHDTEMAVDCILAAPMGGLALGSDMARQLDRQYVFPEKKTTALATEGAREQSSLVFGRHEIQKGSNVLLVEDVCNNFSTTEQVQDLVMDAGAQLAGVCCFLNRSRETRWNALPVISLVHVPTAQYQQDDPEVADDIASGNVAWKPKNDWDRLMAAMDAAKS